MDHLTHVDPIGKCTFVSLLKYSPKGYCNLHGGNNVIIMIIKGFVFPCVNVIKNYLDRPKGS